MSNYQSLFHIIDLKVDIEPLLVYCHHTVCSAASTTAAVCSTMSGGA